MENDKLSFLERTEISKMKITYIQPGGTTCLQMLQLFKDEGTWPYVTEAHPSKRVGCV